MNLAQKYPKIFDKFEDKELELRHLLSIDENYEDYDSEEFEFDVDDYNYIIYIADPLKEALGNRIDEFMVKLHDKDAFENFIATEIDLYGVKTTLNEEQIASLVLDLIEEIL
jgi:hypothetical protein